MAINIKVDFKVKRITKEKEMGNYIMMNGSVHQKDITILTVYASQKKLQNTRSKTDRNERKQTDKFINTVGDFNTPLSVINRTSR